ncbi:VirB4 family type IV secretion system protein [Phaeacidiphilus oryzae]|uniref:VirB4 family type IV secretion system protein n=1 Tax=Phaeacidiphilus oryzae TaxID=348818 RepID=UPI000A6E55E5|nr:conjugal transfer protein TraC [Phaeacidiphilus oryzae]
MTGFLAGLFPPTDQPAPAEPMLGPDSVQLAPRHLAVGDLLAAPLQVTGYPAEVGPGWLDPLLSYPGRLDLAVHIEPVPAAVAADRLRRSRARLESERRVTWRHGRLEDPDTEAAAEDAAELAWRVARGEGKLFRTALYLTVYSDTEARLADEVSAVRAIAESMLLRTAPCTWRPLQGWTSCLPLGLDEIGAARTMDTAALAAAFPFSSPALPTPPCGGVLYGITGGDSLLLWDRWALDNHNSLTLARSGAGKSYLTKLEVLRQLYTGVEAHLVDPEDEYTALARAAGGTVIALGTGGVHLNPLDLDRADGEQALMRRALFAHTFLAVLLGSALDADERAVLDRAVLAAYREAGITTDIRTHARPAPLLADLQRHLAADGDTVPGGDGAPGDSTRGGSTPGAALAARLTPFTTGSHAQLFTGPTTTAPAGHLVSYSLRALPDELAGAGTLLALDRIWRTVTDPAAPRRRLVVVDEAWQLMRDGHGASFLFRMAKSARKHRAGLAVVTQDVADVLATDLGRAVAANAATQILLRQSPQALDAVIDAFHLSAGEAAYLASAAPGEALLCAGPGQRAAFRSLASPREEDLLLTGIHQEET